MTGVGIQGHVGNHPHVGHGLAKRAHHPWHQSIGIERLFGVWCFAAGIYHREKRQGPDPQRVECFGPIQQKIQADPFNAGHGGDRLSDR